MRRGGRRPLRLMHTSDCHLSTDGTGEEAEAFAWAVGLAAELAVDAMLIVGDLFDHARVPDTAIDWTASVLERLGCPVIVIAGNHDVHHDDSVQMRLKATCGDHISFLDEPGGSAIELHDIDLTVWGRAMEEHAPSFLPLEHLPERPDDGWAVVMAHGLVMEHDAETLRGSPIYPGQLERLDWDYVALGHIHRHEVVRDTPVPVRYCGATAWADRGRPGVLVVDLDPDLGATPRLVPRHEA